MSERIKDLAALLRSMQPALNEGVYAFAAITPDADTGALEPIAAFREAEGLTVIVDEQQARQAKLAILFRAAWITLGVHSDLQAVGLTAAVATALSQAGISCNVVAAAFHDHVFVPIESAQAALAVLQQLQQRSSPGVVRPATCNPPTMTVLARMRAEVFEDYLASSIAGYADDNVAAGRWPADGAVARSAAAFHSLLPQGLQTPDNYLYEVKAGDTGPAVGFLWFAVEERHGMRGAFVYDVEIKPDHRRLGHARRAFLALESIVAELGLPSIALHAFGHNAAAQALYAQLGYAVTGVNMLKQLDHGRR